MMVVDVDRLAGFKTIDLTTIGRRSGALTRVEIWWFRVDGRFIITGTPGPRDWYANVLADSSVVVNVDGLVLAATADPIEDPVFRRRVFTHPDTRWYTTQAQLEQLLESSPMIELHFAD
jgi:deazaflavin-dependent oxidoreductase (nitroreductase family)